MASKIFSRGGVVRRIFSALVLPLFMVVPAAALVGGGAASAATLTPAATCTYGPCGGGGVVTVTVTQGPKPGEVIVKVSGSNFAPFEIVVFILTPDHTTAKSTGNHVYLASANEAVLDASSSYSVGSTKASSSGTFSSAVELPGGLAPGNYTLTAVGESSGKTASFPVTLTQATSGASPCAAAYTTHSSGIVLAASYHTAACASQLPPSAQLPSSGQPSAVGQSGSAPSAAGPAAATPQSSSSLPFTGANAETGAAIGAIALAAGGALVLSSRRRRKSAWR